MTLRSFFAVLGFFLLTMLSQNASAQTDPFYTPPQPQQPQPAGTAPAPAGENGSFFGNMEGSINVLKGKLGANGGGSMGKLMQQAALTIAQKLKAPALAIAGSLALVYLMYEVLQFMAGRTPSITQALFDVAIPCMVAGMLISSYEARLADFELLLDFFRNHGAGAGGSPVDQLLDMYYGIVKNIGSAFKNLLTGHGGALAMLLKPGEMAAALVDAIATLLFVLVILYLVITGSAEMFGLLLMGPFLHAVGIAFGPILIAGLVTPWTKDFFKKWVLFLVVSAALSGVLNVILSIAATLIGGGGLGVAEYANSEPAAVNMLITALLIMTVNSMISQAPSIASALLPGTIGAGKHGGAELKNALKKATSTGKQSVKQAGRIVGIGKSKTKAPAPKP
jgi:hypothetical protein